MAAVWYTGPSDSRTITSAEWCGRSEDKSMLSCEPEINRDIKEKKTK